MDMQQALQFLEIDLRGSKVTVVMDKGYQENIKNLFGNIGVSSLSDLKESVDRTLKGGRNYILFDEKIRLDSQNVDLITDTKKSIIFGYSPSAVDPNEIYLNILQIGEPRVYNGARKINFDGVDKIVKQRKLEYSSVPYQVLVVDKINFSIPSELKAQSKSVTVAEETISTSDSVDVGEGIKNEKWLELVDKENRRFRQKGEGEILPPQIKWVYLNNYDLSNLEKNFVVAGFERRVDTRHVGEMLQSVLENKFFDIVFRVVDLGIADVGDRKYRRFGLIDAQHRTHVFRVARDHYGLKTYNFMLSIHRPEDARDIYEKLNMGKRLTPEDYTKVWDDGTSRFFNQLREMLSYHKDQKTVSFIEMLYAHEYAVRANTTVSLARAEKVLDEIGPKEIEKMKTFLRTTAPVVGVNRGNNPFYRVAIFRNAYKTFYENDMDKDDLAALLNLIMDDSKIIEKSRYRGKENFDTIYKLVKEKLDAISKNKRPKKSNKLIN